MGVDYHFYLILGTPVTQDQFFDITDTGLKCRHGHPQTGDAKFCPRDGTPFRASEKIEANEKLKAFLNLDEDNGEAEDWWNEPPYTEDLLGIHKVDSYQSSEDRGEFERVLGIRLFDGDSGGYRGTRDSVALTNDILEKGRHQIHKAMVALEITGDINLYPVVYASC